MSDVIFHAPAGILTHNWDLVSDFYRWILSRRIDKEFGGHG
jgi:hypothetical protein